LLEEIYAFGYAQGRNIALDSTPIKAHCRPPTKRGALSTNPDAQRGFSKSKGGGYFGYKAQVVVDAKNYLPLYAITTSANISDQKMVKPFIQPLKHLNYRSERALLDAGYDNEFNHLILREELGSISMICPNRRRFKKTYSMKLVKKYGKLLHQTTLDRYLPKAKRQKEYRRACLVLHDQKEFKQLYWMRTASKQQFAT